MLFPSLVFIVYFLPVVIAGYYMLMFSRGAQNIWLLAASLVFYAWGEPVLVFAMLISIALNYFLLLAISGNRENRRAAFVLTVAACALNLGLLFALKQLFQIIVGVGYYLSLSTELLPVPAIPIGISFFTLRTVSYAVDVYKGAAKTPRSPIDAALYIAFFPTFIAGPVMRYSEMEEQLLRRTHTWRGFSVGVCGFITGLAKKVLIADSMATIANHVFSYSAMSNEVTQVPALLAWLGAVAFTLQIYFDLSGYSDMAVGLGRMFGFELKEGFNYPYASRSISEFWNRWNITLSEWFRDYIYFPLGGSQVKNNDKMVRNIFIMWLFFGVWHGAKLTFLLWGIWQVMFVVFESVISYERRSIPAPVRRIYVLVTVLFGFVIFRTDDIYQTTLYFSNMFGLNHNGFFSDLALMFVREYWVFLAAGIVFSTPVAKKISGVAGGTGAGKLGVAIRLAYPVLMISAFYVTMTYIVRAGGRPFIYFRF